MFIAESARAHLAGGFARRGITVVGVRSGRGYSFRLYDQSVTAVTDVFPIPPVEVFLEARGEQDMTPKLALIISTVVVIAAFVAINSWAAVPKHESNSAAPIAAKGTIYRPALWKVY